MPKQLYLAIWGSSYSKPGYKLVDLPFFDASRGYEPEDLQTVADLGIGQTATLDAGDHTVTRCPDRTIVTKAVIDLLSNDEYSTDDELKQHLISKLGLESDQADAWIAQRDTFLTNIVLI